MMCNVKKHKKENKMPHIKNINNFEQFHGRVLELQKISDADDRHLTTKLKGKTGELEGRFVTFLKKLASVIPGLHFARTNPLEVAKAIEQFAEDHKSLLIKEDQIALTSIVEKLKTKGVKQLKGKEPVIEKIIEKINQLIS